MLTQGGNNNSACATLYGTSPLAAPRCFTKGTMNESFQARLTVQLGQ